MGIYSQFCEMRSVLFSTDVASRGLDFNKAVDWVVQVLIILFFGKKSRVHVGKKKGREKNILTGVLHLFVLFRQLDCPEDVASYIHRVGRTARYHSGGRSVLFLMPSEMKMLEKLQAAKVPVQFIKVDYFYLQSPQYLVNILFFRFSFGGSIQLIVILMYDLRS